MSLDKPEFTAENASELFVCIVAARYNEEIVNELLENTVQTLFEAGVRPESLLVVRVPGSNELPYAAHMHAMTGEFDVIIALGVVIAGDTSHHEVIALSTAHAFHEIGTKTEVPVINGILTTNTREQALQRASTKINRGGEFARAALEMAQLKVQMVTALDEIDEARTRPQKAADEATDR